ncbi:MAG: hypothetical protein WD294_02365 [Phycisphaeraceae bacterium]
MGDDLRKVQPGQPLRIPASTFNTFIDAAREHRARQHTVSVAAGRSVGGHTPSVVPVRNDTGVDFTNRFRIVGLDEPIYDRSENPAGFDNHIAFKAVTPSLPEHTGRFGILLEPVREGGIAKAIVHGVCQVRISVPAGGESHRLAEVDDGDTNTLSAGPGGSASILWKEAGIGTKWAIVRLDGMAATPTVFARITGSAEKRHAWIEQQWNAGGEVEDNLDGLSGSSSSSQSHTSAYERNGLVVRTDTLVLLQREIRTDGSWRWIFDYPIPHDTGQYKVFQLDADNKPHWDWVRAH